MHLLVSLPYLISSMHSCRLFKIHTTSSDQLVSHRFLDLINVESTAFNCYKLKFTDTVCLFRMILKKTAFIQNSCLLGRYTGSLGKRFRYFSEDTTFVFKINLYFKEPLLLNMKAMGYIETSANTQCHITVMICLNNTV